MSKILQNIILDGFDKIGETEEIKKEEKENKKKNQILLSAEEIEKIRKTKNKQ